MSYPWEIWGSAARSWCAMASTKCPLSPRPSKSHSPGGPTGRWPACSSRARCPTLRSSRRRPGIGAQLLNRGDFFLFGDPEGRSAAAGRDHIWVLDLEPRPLKPVDEVDRRALHVGEALSVDKKADALVLEDGVAGARLVEGERVLKAAAAAAANPDPEPGRLGHRALRPQEFPDLFGALVCQRDHASASIATVELELRLSSCRPHQRS